MPPTVATEVMPSHLVRLENLHPSMAKADLKNLEKGWKVAVGHAVTRIYKRAGLSQKQFAAAIDRDPGQVGRWESGTERPQFDAIFAVESLRQPCVISLAELAGEAVRVKTTIEIERVA